LEQREDGVPLVCLETALPVKFSAVINEALGRDPDMPPGLENLEHRPQRFSVLDPDVAAVKDLIEGGCRATACRAPCTCTPLACFVFEAHRQIDGFDVLGQAADGDPVD